MTVEVWNVTSGGWVAYRDLGGTCLNLKWYVRPNRPEPVRL